MTEVITIDIKDSMYPERLREIEEPPEWLWLEGRTELLEKRAIAVVGSRKATAYGRNVAAKLGKRAAELGIVLISGMAYGIDGEAQQAALDAGGDVIAVLAGGADICYPKGNEGLYRGIKEKGLIVSEQPPGTEPRRFMFPQRNRIIAALAEIVVVVEAGIRSGAVITAEHAADQGRALFAVPGDIFRHESMGTNSLISDGTMILTKIDDPFVYMGVNKPRPEGVIAALGEDERKIVSILLEKGERTMEQLVLESGMKADMVSRIVSILEMKGVLVTSMGRVFVEKV